MKACKALWWVGRGIQKGLLVLLAASLIVFFWWVLPFFGRDD